MKIRKLGDKKPKVVLFQGSPRDKDTCPNMNSKSHNLVDYILEQWSPFIEFTVIDLAVNQKKKPVIQPCKGCVSTAGGYHCHWKCVSHDQRVHTKSGFVKIENIKVGDVLQDGNAVTNHVKTSDSEMIYELKLSDGRRIELTKEHKVKILSKDRYRTKESNWEYFRKEDWLELKDIKIGDNMPYIEKDYIFDDNVKYNDFLIYGLIWGDGTFAKNTPLLYIDKKEFEFISEIENILGDKIKSILEHRIVDSFFNYKTEMIKVNFGTKIGKEMLLVLPKNKAKDRRLNMDCFKSNSDIFNFFNGWISTDGSVSKKGIHLYNTSYNCLRDAQLLLSRVGIRSNISDISHIKGEIRGKKYQRASCLSIYDQESVIIFYNNVKLINPKKQSKINDYINSKRRKVKNNYSKVKSIKEIGYKPVYDIEVENSHEFNCEGINIHNCSCYFKGNKNQPDLLKELDVYDHLEKSDAFIILSPIHWHALSAQIKTLFDRLVCANLTLTVDNAKKLMGDGNIKNSDITGQFSKSGEYDDMLQNHLEGKVCAFYAHGDDGANEYSDGNYPDSYSDVIKDNFSVDPKSVVMPYVMQMKYSGVYVPDELIQAFYVNKGKDYYSANVDMSRESEFFERADTLIDNLLEFLEKKSN